MNLNINIFKRKLVIPTKTCYNVDNYNMYKPEPILKCIKKKLHGKFVFDLGGFSIGVFVFAYTIYINM